MSQLSLARTVVMLPTPARVLFVGTFINRFGNFLGPFLVLYLTAKGYTPGQAGLALGVVGLGNTAGNALGGTVADRLGRRATIVLSMAGSGVCTLAVSLVGPSRGSSRWWASSASSRNCTAPRRPRGALGPRR